MKKQLTAEGTGKEKEWDFETPRKKEQTAEEAGKEWYLETPLKKPMIAKGAGKEKERDNKTPVKREQTVKKTGKERDMKAMMKELKKMMKDSHDEAEELVMKYGSA